MILFLHEGTTCSNFVQRVLFMRPCPSPSIFCSCIGKRARAVLSPPAQVTPRTPPTPGFRARKHPCLSSSTIFLQQYRHMLTSFRTLHTAFILVLPPAVALLFWGSGGGFIEGGAGAPEEEEGRPTSPATEAQRRLNAGEQRPPPPRRHRRQRRQWRRRHRCGCGNPDGEHSCRQRGEGGGTGAQTRQLCAC